MIYKISYGTQMLIQFIKSLTERRRINSFSIDDLITKQNDSFRKINKMQRIIALMGTYCIRLHIPKNINDITIHDGFRFTEHRSIHNISWDNLFMHNNGAIIFSCESSFLGIDTIKPVLDKIQHTNKFDNQHHSSGKITHNNIILYWAIDRYDLKHGKGFIKPTETDFMDNGNTLVMRVYV